MSKESDRLSRLQRRLDHLETRMALSGHKNSYDYAEASALKWAIRLCDLALANWPAGVKAVRDQSNTDSS